MADTVRSVSSTESASRERLIPVSDHAMLKVTFSDEGAKRFVAEERNFTRLQDIVARLGDELKAAIRERDTLQELSRKQEQELKQYAGIVKVLEDECQRSAEVNRQLAAECNACIEETEQLQATEQQLLREVADLRDQLSRSLSFQAESANRQHADRGEFVARCDAAERELREAQDAHAREMAAAEQHFEQVAADLARAHKEVEGLRKQNRVLSARVAQLEMAEEQVPQEMAQLHADKSALLAQLKHAEAMCAQLQTTAEMLAKRDADREKRCHECEQRVMQLERDYCAVVEERNQMLQDNLVLLQLCGQDALEAPRTPSAQKLGGAATTNHPASQYTLEEDSAVADEEDILAKPLTPPSHKQQGSHRANTNSAGTGTGTGTGSSTRFMAPVSPIRGHHR